MKKKKKYKITIPNTCAYKLYLCAFLNVPKFVRLSALEVRGNTTHVVYYPPISAVRSNRVRNVLFQGPDKYVRHANRNIIIIIIIQNVLVHKTVTVTP